MSITASRFGSAPLLLDWSGIQTEITPTRRAELHQHFDRMRVKLHDQVSGFYNAATDSTLSAIDASESLASNFLANPSFRHCVFIGIGGSSLGPLFLIDALKHRAKSQIQFHFFENPDPIDWTYRISKLNPSETLVCVVTKSGTTYETLSIFMLAYDWLKRALGRTEANRHCIAITDPEKGELLEFARRESIATLPIAPSVGGRFSIFTPVGLFAGALSGLNMRELLTGGKKVRDYCEKATAEKNNFLTWAEALHSRSKTHGTHVMMPYTSPLKLLANWWVQLWAESLGKDGKGFTAVPALGSIDQHSMLQLLRDGPNDKVIWFVNLSDFKTRVPIPSIDFKVKTFDLLEGQELGDLLTTEFRAIQKVMTNQRRPHLQLQIEELNEEALGSLFFSLSVLTAYMGEIMGVNPFDQPGVEEGKVYIREKLEQNKREQHSKNDADDESVHRLRLHRE
jgi:glucose-6-phosphate isomerase